ncbi:MAG: hypothetical protein WEH44_07180, partial [Pirellulaceae bacterium]
PHFSPWWADTPANVLSAIQQLEHGQWLISDQWVPPASRLHIGTDSNAGALGNPLPALVQPKLLIVIPFESVVPDLRRAIAEAFHGPLLFLESCTTDQLRDEVLAAIAAME